MARDMLETYRLGHKTAYYQNTYDIKTDEVEEPKQDLQSLLQELSDADETTCDSCSI
jgi:ribonucleoside-diphosphate reductase alpha chain